MTVNALEVESVSFVPAVSKACVGISAPAVLKLGQGEAGTYIRLLSLPPVRHPDDHGAYHLHQVCATLRGPPEREPLGQQGCIHVVHRAVYR